MQIPYRNNKDFYAGILVTAVGVTSAILGANYTFGTVSKMGTGFVPTCLGVILAIIGVLIVLTGLRSEEADSHAEWKLPDLRGSVCIIGGLLGFLVCARYMGFLPASLVLIFVSAMGDKEHTVKSAAILSIVVTAFGMGLFHYALGLQFPLFSWGE